MPIDPQTAAQALRELRRRKQASAPTYDESFPEQDEFVKDPDRFVLGFCTRRAGKTHGIARKLINKGKRYPGSTIPYVSLTRDSAKNIVWPVFKEIEAIEKLGLKFIESELIVRMTNGTQIKLYGADQENFIQRLLGGKYPIAAIDEGQSFRGHLSTLIDDVLTAAIGDYGTDGQIILCGTPGPVPKGYFHDASLGAFGWKVHRWSLYDNPYFPDPRGFVADIKARRGWSDDHPTLRRDYFGEWAADEDALVYKYNEARNSAHSHPELDSSWFYVLGVDLGYSPDPSAFVVCAYSIHLRQMYILSAEEVPELTVEDVAIRIRDYMKRYEGLRVIADLGGQGKMIGEEIKRRYGIPIEAAEKTGKESVIEIMNSDLRKGLIKVLPKASLIAEQWQELVWDSTKAKRTEDARYPNHMADAGLYAWRFCYNYAPQPRPEVIVRGSEREIEKYWQQKEEQMRRDRWEERLERDN